MDGTLDGTALDGFDEGPALGNTVGAVDGFVLGLMDGTLDGTALDGFDEGPTLGNNTVRAVDGVALGSMDGTLDGTALDGFDEGPTLGNSEGAVDAGVISEGRTLGSCVCTAEGTALGNEL